MRSYGYTRLLRKEFFPKKEFWQEAAIGLAGQEQEWTVDRSCIDDAANRLLSRTGNTTDGPSDGHPAIRASYCCRDHFVERYKSACVYGL